MENSKTRSIRYYWMVLPISIVFALQISGYEDSNSVCLLILGVVFLLGWQYRNTQFNIFDIIILSLWVYELVLLFTSINFIASVNYFKALTTSVTFYFILRTSLSRERRMDLFLFWSSLFIAFLSIIGLVAFSSFKERIYEGGFTNLYDFRSLFLPLGNISNVWSNMLLGFLGIIILSLYKNRNTKRFYILLLASLPVLYSLIVSFSRGIYIATLFTLVTLFVVFYITKFIKKYKLIIGLVSFLSIFMITSSEYKFEIQRTFEMTKTVSQQRSIEGRVNTGNIAYLIFLDNPLVGVGSGNFSLAANVHSYENNPHTYTNNASSFIFQLIVEKGLVGVLLWMSILLLTLVTIFQTKNYKVESIIAFIFIFGLFIRELTFPVLLDNLGLQIIIFTYFAIIQNNRKNKIRKCYPASIRRTIRLFPLVIWGLLYTFHYFEAEDIKNNSKCISLINNDLPKALEYINKTRETTPYLINKATLSYKIYLNTKDTNYLVFAESLLKEANKKNPIDFQITNNLAIILNENKKSKEAYLLLKDLTEKFSENPQFQISMYQLIAPIDKGKASKYLVKAIFLEPSLLETSLWAETIKDSLFSKMINSMISERLYQKEADNPLELARNARIFMELKDTVLAKKHLEYVVEIMPNLPRPWAHLGKIYYDEGNKEKGKKCLIASLAIDPLDNITNKYWTYYTGEKRITQTDNKFSSMYSIYYAKYRKWYCSMPIHLDDFSKIVIR
ncbi:O-antigen ligase family protein [Dysgonomonas sp. Marseille-P4677]|uniref:O-antigen ligase family protein n=1 Tax=Dysgonomonas sp. Marseille-P4677 TaxID=2364790 RepID=UPI001914D876|nr:O-antigen ligase family protein [Dysgonomonas sp. Marseille-P4677]MBK5722230.1 O-antigen ligase family protein [Dysgonomonas sp. Marseille-P4677]